MPKMNTRRIFVLSSSKTADCIYVCWPMSEREFRVARAGGGYATVVIKKRDSGTRMIYFEICVPIGADTDEADGYPGFRATKENDLRLIRIGDERY